MRLPRREQSGNGIHITRGASSARSAIRTVTTGFVAAMLCAGVAQAEVETKSPSGSFYAVQVQPILDRSCVVCHGPEKKKAGLRLDTHAAVLQGGDAGPVVIAGAAEQSELYRRIVLPADDDEVMPSDGKPLLSPAQIKIVRAWIEAGAAMDSIPRALDLPATPVAGTLSPPAPDYRPFRAQIVELEKTLPIRLVPVSQVPTDGIIVRTASGPERVDDAVVAGLVPIAPLIVDAEFSRTRISDAALKVVARFPNIRRLDVAHTAVTSAGVSQLVELKKLESLNVVATQVDATSWETLRRMPALRAVFGFGTTLGTDATAGTAGR